MLTIVNQPVGTWRVLATVFVAEANRLPVAVAGVVGNSVPTSALGKAILLRWKRLVASAAKSARGAGPLDPHLVYAVSAGFSFHPQSHGNQPLDVENVLKPTLDGLAAGLFCDNSADPLKLERFNYDDTGFRYLFAYRLPDASSQSSEGAGLVVSILSGSNTSAGTL